MSRSANYWENRGADNTSYGPLESNLGLADKICHGMTQIVSHQNGLTSILASNCGIVMA